MKEYKINESNKIIVKVGQIEEEIGDALLSWSAINLRTGPDSFHRIHRKAGSQVLGSIILLESSIKEGSAFTSIPGLTNFFTIIHSILPIHPALYNDSFFNIIKTIKVYQETNICRDLYLTFPFKPQGMILDHLLTYSNQLNNFTFYIIVEEQKDFVLTCAILDDKIKSKLSKFLKKIFLLFLK